MKAAMPATDLDYAAGQLPAPSVPGGVAVFMAQFLLLYFALCTLTLPFVDRVWVLGEIPLLALIPLPKTALANALRTGLVMPLLRALGLSRGSFSPDYGLAGPYALALAYLILLFVPAVMLLLRMRSRPSCRCWLLALLGIAAVDYLVLLLYAAHPRGLTIY